MQNPSSYYQSKEDLAVCFSSGIFIVKREYPLLIRQLLLAGLDAIESVSAHYFLVPLLALLFTHRCSPPGCRTNSATLGPAPLL